MARATSVDEEARQPGLLSRAFAPGAGFARAVSLHNLLDAQHLDALPELVRASRIRAGLLGGIALEPRCYSPDAVSVPHASGLEWSDAVGRCHCTACLTCSTHPHQQYDRAHSDAHRHGHHFAKTFMASLWGPALVNLKGPCALPKQRYELKCGPSRGCLPSYGLCS